MRGVVCQNVLLVCHCLLKTVKGRIHNSKAQLENCDGTVVSSSHYSILSFNVQDLTLNKQLDLQSNHPCQYSATHVSCQIYSNF